MRRFGAGLLVDTGASPGETLKGKSPPVSRPFEMCYYPFMASQKTTAKNDRNGGFVLGRERFAKISAVEGIELSGAMKKRVRDADRKGLSAEARRAAIIRAHSKG
ncbi:MAG TPA: hypothetical protein VN838_03505 [Bradyrhizobium sp.]|nr:hypothetical protein [Bradyrhizobium sp.]